MFCDIFTLFHSESLKQLMTGEMGGMIITQAFLLGFAILMEIVMVMIVLSRFLHYKTNRILDLKQIRLKNPNIIDALEGVDENLFINSDRRISLCLEKTRS